MDLAELKNNFHSLIDENEDDELLLTFFEMMERTNSTPDGSLWSILNNNEQTLLFELSKVSAEDENLVYHEEIKQIYKKWLQR